MKHRKEDLVEMFKRACNDRDFAMEKNRLLIAENARLQRIFSAASNNNDKLRDRLLERDEALAELHAALVRYEGDVDGEAPSEHRRMMDRAAALLPENGKHVHHYQRRRAWIAGVVW